MRLVQGEEASPLCKYIDSLQYEVGSQAKISVISAPFGNHTVLRADYPDQFKDVYDPDSVPYDFAVLTLDAPVVIEG